MNEGEINKEELLRNQINYLVFRNLNIKEILKSNSQVELNRQFDKWIVYKIKD